MAASLARINVDGLDYDVQSSANLLEACLSKGLDIPYFCWHPALGSVGACRQCAVKQFKDADDRTGKIVMSCMTAAADGTRISIDDPEAAAFRKSVIEWLMTNHPHDCPVCEEGGECHLQDMTLMTGHTQRRYPYTKRTHRNQYLGPFVKHEMNRCIACYRCVRFYRDYAGGRDLDVYAIHNAVYFGRSEDGVLESEFSGNLVEVCPTGVFTDKTLSERYVRKWDFAGAPSVCVHCSLGCNTIANARYNELRRIVNRYNGEVNRYFICDRGRFGYQFVNAPTRLRTSVVARGDGSAAPVSADEARERVAAALKDGRALGIGSPRASLEANFALRELVGADRFYLGVSDAEHRMLESVLEVMRNGTAPTASLRDAEDSDAVLILGEDVANTAPRLALSLRQTVRGAAIALAARQRIPHWQDAAVRDAGRDVRTPLFIATPGATRLDEVATGTLRAAPDDIVRVAYAVIGAIDGGGGTWTASLSLEMGDQVKRVADALKGASRPLIVSGVGSGSEAMIRAAGSLAQALKRAGRDARICLIASECNSIGLALMGGQPLSHAFDALRATPGQALIVLENDLYRRADADSVDAALDAASHVVALDHTLTETVRRSHVALPAATFAEGAGTLVNNEGRAQRFFQVLYPEDDVRDSWRWLNELAHAAGRTQAKWRSLDEAIAAMSQAVPAVAAAGDAAPSSEFRIAGNAVRSKPHRYSGRTAMYANRTMREPPPVRPVDAPFTNSMEGYYGEMPSALYPFFWTPMWNSAQAVNKFQDEIGGPLRGGDPGVRLIEPRAAATFESPREPPPAFEQREGRWLIVPRHCVFGSDELSALAPAVAERIEAPTLALNETDAAGLSVREGDRVRLAFDAFACTTPVRFDPELPCGVAALSISTPAIAALPLPAWAALEREQ